jgi:putative Mg2+ transporter-C (MgtC) family protein
MTLAHPGSNPGIRAPPWRATYLGAMSHADLVLLGRIAVGFAICFVIGFERGLRGSIAGDRTFALVGVSATAVTAVAAHSSPQAIAGVVTGIGFIGAGVMIQGGGGPVHGLTSAACIFTSASLGVVVGFGHLMLGVISGLAVLVVLEIRYIPALRFLDASVHAARHMRQDAHLDAHIEARLDAHHDAGAEHAASEMADAAARAAALKTDGSGNRPVS